MAHYPYGVCQKSADGSKQSSIFYDLCKFWVHTKCNQLNFLDFQLVLNHGFVLNASAICFLLVHLIIKILVHLFLTITIIINTGSSINLEPHPNLSLLFKQFHDLSSHLINKNPENMMTNCKYYDIDDIQKIKSKPNSVSLPLFHLNACSLNKSFDELEYLIKTTNQTFDVTAISVPRIKSNMDITTNINLPN